MLAEVRAAFTSPGRMPRPGHGIEVWTLLETTYPHITKPPGEPARLTRVPRIRVAQLVMDYIAHGWSADEMVRQHPNLRQAEVHAAMAYYFDHDAEISAEIRAEWSQVDQERTEQLPSALVLRLLASRRS